MFSHSFFLFRHIFWDSIQGSKRKVGFKEFLIRLNVLVLCTIRKHFLAFRYIYRVCQSNRSSLSLSLAFALCLQYLQSAFWNNIWKYRKLKCALHHSKILGFFYFMFFVFVSRLSSGACAGIEGVAIWLCLCVWVWVCVGANWRTPTWPPLIPDASDSDENNRPWPTVHPVPLAPRRPFWSSRFPPPAAA